MKAIFYMMFSDHDFFPLPTLTTHSPPPYQLHALPLFQKQTKISHQQTNTQRTYKTIKPKPQDIQAKDQ